MWEAIKQKSTPLFERWGLVLFLWGVFFIPLKLSLAYFGLIPALALFLTSTYAEETFKLPLFRRYLGFISIVVLTSFFGIDPLHSLRQETSLIFFPFVIPLAAFYLKREAVSIFATLLAGKTVASFHTIVVDAFPEALKRVLLSRVTDSGQMGIILLFAVAIAFILYKKASPSERSGILTNAGAGGLLLGLGLFLGFTPLFSVPLAARVTFALLFIVFIALLIFKARVLLRTDGRPIAYTYLLFSTVLPLLTAAFIINMKRGPWLGFSCGMAVFLLLVARRGLPYFLVAGLAAAVLIAPVRERLSQSSDHFFIHGGRNVIWEIGAELAPRNPLGIGYGNSPILIKYSSQIPPELKHFHNNFINIAIEAGWCGVFFFLFWTIELIAKALRSGNQLAQAGGCAVISWQLAGLVEYNFGDSELMLVAYLLVAAIEIFRGQENPAKSTETHKNAYAISS